MNPTPDNKGIVEEFEKKFWVEGNDPDCIGSLDDIKAFLLKALATKDLQHQEEKREIISGMPDSRGYPIKCSCITGGGIDSLCYKHEVESYQKACEEKYLTK